MTEETTGRARRTGVTKVGVVVSHSGTKTAVVRVVRTVGHGAYRRYVKRSARFMAHDERNACRVGDTVEIVESRPLSARKRWRVRKVVRAAVAGLHDGTPHGGSAARGGAR